MVVPSIDSSRLVHASRLVRLKSGRRFAVTGAAIAIAGLLTGCMAGSSYHLGADAPGVGLDTAASPEASASPAEFKFPQASCSDRESTPTSTWYPVVVKGGNLDEIRAKYCQDAISTIQAITGEPMVQVASFTSLEKAQQFAQLVGGTVDAQPIAQGTGSPTPGLNPANSPPTNSPPASSPSASSPTASPAPQSSSTAASSTGGSGTLNTGDGSPINIRTSASTDALVQEVGSSGESVQILSSSQGSDGYTWYNVQTAGGITGWVRGDLVSSSSTPGSTAAAPGNMAPSPSPLSTASSPAPNSSPTTSRQSSVITASNPDAMVNVRASASTDAPVQTTAYAGDPVRIVSSSQGGDGYTWYNVQFESGATGWVRGDFVQN